ncbi:MAG: calcium/sodium antiporter [Oscillospiraceae bacterium]|nr:calcium/sodium antiporter [Oscillospiraceae bacterium]
MEIFIQILLLIAGFALLIKGADWFVDGASGIADRFGIPQIVIGLTIVAFGTSAPEAAVSITAALNDSAGLAVGNVVGSNILNILIILGLTALITPVAVQNSTLKYEIPFVIIITIVLGILGAIGGNLNIVDSIILLALFVLFFVYLIRISKSGQPDMAPAESGENAQKKNIFWLILLTIIGIVMIVIGSDVTVDAASAIATRFGMSERLIGLTIVALGTSLPELVTSVLAAKKGNADIAIGNIVGSNIFNILFILGVTALITTVPYAANFIIDTVVAVFAAVVLLLCVINKDRKLKRPAGAIMLGLYAVYFVYLVVFTSAA